MSLAVFAEAADAIIGQAVFGGEIAKAYAVETTQAPQGCDPDAALVIFEQVFDAIVG